MEDSLTLQSLFAKSFGEKDPEIIPMKGDGSGRRLFRLKGGKRTVVGAINTDRRENAAFLGFSRHFRREGLNVPEIYAQDDAAGAYLEEDLGDTNLFELLSKRRSEEGFPADVVAVYERAVDALPRFQADAGRTLDYSLCYPRSRFDKQSMMWDLNYFKYYFLRLAGVPFDEQALEDDFERFTALLLQADGDYFLYRDFQSRNIMVRDGQPWFIDYQGGRKGALQYDIASLLFDAKADVPFSLRKVLLDRYLDSTGKRAAVDRKRFLALYPAFVYIRIMQALGAYGLRGFYERKSHFLQSIPYAIRNLERLLNTTELPVDLPALSEVFRRLVSSSKLRQFGKARLGLTVRVQSFSFKSGVPTDERGHGGGFVFDCRALPNPGRETRYARSTGMDADVIEYLEKAKGVDRFLEHSFALVDQAVENYLSRNFTDLLIAYGCTGGQHRSVYCAERLAKHLREKHHVDVEVRHRGREPLDA
jgi:aminoglycoside/choline kinase family phosphotransferase